MKKQCVAFFHVYHRARLEELRTFLENEAWEVCPVKPTFSVYSLQVSARAGRRVCRNAAQTAAFPTAPLGSFSAVILCGQITCRQLST